MRPANDRAWCGHATVRVTKAACRSFADVLGGHRSRNVSHLLADVVPAHTARDACTPSHINSRLPLSHACPLCYQGCHDRNLGAMPGKGAPLTTMRGAGSSCAGGYVRICGHQSRWPIKIYDNVSLRCDSDPYRRTPPFESKCIDRHRGRDSTRRVAELFECGPP